MTLIHHDEKKFSCQSCSTEIYGNKLTFMRHQRSCTGTAVIEKVPQTVTESRSKRVVKKSQKIIDAMESERIMKNDKSYSKFLERQNFLTPTADPVEVDETLPREVHLETNNELLKNEHTMMQIQELPGQNLNESAMNCQTSDLLLNSEQNLMLHIQKFKIVVKKELYLISLFQ